VVLSEQLTGTPVPEALKGKLRFSNLAPADLMAELAGQGVQRVYVDGGQLVQSFLRDGLVADMVITTVPVLIGSGRRLFGGLQRDIDWELVSNCSFHRGWCRLAIG
jgi:dihydrofolate reductase